MTTTYITGFCVAYTNDKFGNSRSFRNQSLECIWIVFLVKIPLHHLTQHWCHHLDNNKFQFVEFRRPFPPVHKNRMTQPWVCLMITTIEYQSCEIRGVDHIVLSSNIKSVTVIQTILYRISLRCYQGTSSTIPRWGRGENVCTISRLPR